jgi:hypothetical protein
MLEPFRRDFRELSLDIDGVKGTELFTFKGDHVGAPCVRELRASHLFDAGMSWFAVDVLSARVRHVVSRLACYSCKVTATPRGVGHG